MPLNPPTYAGLDVFYSNNVFVNKVPVALWRPPAGAFNDGSPGTASVGGLTMYSSNESGHAAMLRNEAALMGEGAKGDDNGGDPASSGISSSAGATGAYNDFSATGPNPNPSAPSGTYELSVDNLPNSFPTDISDPFYNKQISQYFKMAHIRNPPQNESTFNLSARQVAANFIELCLNVLDPVYAQFHFNKDPLNSAYRSTAYNQRIGGSLTSEHITGCAADISLGTPSGNVAMFKWILNSGIKFRQLLYEKSPSGSAAGWIHVSYNRGIPKSDASRVGYTTNPPSIISAGQNGENLPSYLKA